MVLLHRDHNMTPSNIGSFPLKNLVEEKKSQGQSSKPFRAEALLQRSPDNLHEVLGVFPLHERGRKDCSYRNPFGGNNLGPTSGLGLSSDVGVPKTGPAILKGSKNTTSTHEHRNEHQSVSRRAEEVQCGPDHQAKSKNLSAHRHEELRDTQAHTHTLCSPRRR